MIDIVNYGENDFDFNFIRKKVSIYVRITSVLKMMITLEKFFCLSDSVNKRRYFSLLKNTLSPIKFYIEHTSNLLPL